MSHEWFTQKSRADKAINTLKGLTQGIISDGKVTDGELDELKKWAASAALITTKEPFREFMTAISELDPLSGDERLSEIEDIYWLCQQFDTEEGVYYDALTADIQTLMGFCEGLMSDRILEDQEIHALESWLFEHEHLEGHFIYDQLIRTVQEILEDGIIEDHEREKLINILNSITSGGLESKTESQMSPTLIFTSVGIRDVVDNSFVLTGEFKIGKRKELENILRECGAKINPSPSKKTDFVVVGEAGSSSWAYTRFGRKVEQAIELRKKSVQIEIIRESCLTDYLVRNGHI